MKASELRIGNCIMSDECGLTTVNGSLIQFLETPKSLVTGFVEPIPLTEEWLLRFGFERMYLNTSLGPITLNYVIKGNICVSLSDMMVEFNEPNVCIDICEYVHKFQNLYFALTGEELAIN